MKRLFLNFMVCTAMVSALALTSCGDDNEGDGNGGDGEGIVIVHAQSDLHHVLHPVEADLGHKAVVAHRAAVDGILLHIVQHGVGAVAGA